MTAKLGITQRWAGRWWSLGQLPHAVWSFQAFARRALGKISELSQLESMSCSPQSKDTEEAFRQATIKVNDPRLPLE